MVEFEDPITDTSYNPIGDPSGTLLKSVYAVAGITMTLLLLGVAQNSVLPQVQSFVESLLGLDTGSGNNVVQFGDP